jgi:hypothetical protein
MHFAAKVLLRVPASVANISHDPPRLVAAGGKLETSKARGQYQARGAVSGVGQSPIVACKIGLMLMSESCQHSEASGFALTPTANS